MTDVQIAFLAGVAQLADAIPHIATKARTTAKPEKAGNPPGVWGFGVESVRRPASGTLPCQADASSSTADGL